MRSALCTVLMVGWAGELLAQDAQSPSPPTLAEVMNALAQRRLIARETGSVERMRELVIRGERQYLDGLYDQAMLTHYEVVESPRFSDFSDLDEFQSAEFMLASSLFRLGALRTAEKYLLQILARGAEGPYFAPAYRRFTDVALGAGNLARPVGVLEGLETGDLPEDAENELRYLRGRERFDAGDAAAADNEFREITRRSRFYANAQYLRGALAAESGALDRAEELFCSIADAGTRDRYSFYVDDRFFDVRDLAQLGLGRLAHEGGRGDDAFYYYFQVPSDSPRVSEALFEAAYAMYEAGDTGSAVDLLDQLDARFPDSAFVDEAALLRGYVHLGRCEFERADRQFVRFTAQFGPVHEEVRRILANPAHTDSVIEALLSERAHSEASARGVVLSLLDVDPTFFDLHMRVRTLDAEAARAGLLASDIGAIRARVDGGDRPRAAIPADEPLSEEQALREDIATGREAVRTLVEQLDALRRGERRAARGQVGPLYAELRKASRHLTAIEARLIEEIAPALEAPAPAPGAGRDLSSLLVQDARHAALFPARVAALRARLLAAAGQAALRALEILDRRLEAELRRARIGRIDAVMGSKRRIEIQIQSLSAGRFPAELQDPLLIQGLLRDDEEYWPFEGELWEDEFDPDIPLSTH